ncbi:MAG: sigma-70 family RNA polymerase sigma factor [Pirellulales bacterium]
MVEDSHPIDESRLIDETLAGDSAAFGRLVGKYQDRLYNTMAHLVGLEDARDLVQDAFVQAFVKLETFQRTSAFYTWLYRIAFNLAMSRKRRQRPSVSMDGLRERTGHEPVDGSAAPQDRLEQQELAGQVQAALATLSEEHRVVLVLREMDGCCYETIAEILELPVGTVRSRLHRGRMQLREHLKQVLQVDHP